MGDFFGFSSLSKCFTDHSREKFVASFQGLLVLLLECRAKPLEALVRVFVVAWLLKHIPASLGNLYFSFLNCEILAF